MQKKATEKAAQKNRNATAASAKQIGEALAAAVPAQQNSTSLEAAKPTAGGAKGDGGKGGGKPAPASAGQAKFFTAENGDKLDWLSNDEFLRVRKCCYDFAQGKCNLYAAECLEKNKKGQ